MSTAAQRLVGTTYLDPGRRLGMQRRLPGCRDVWRVVIILECDTRLRNRLAMRSSLPAALSKILQGKMSSLLNEGPLE